VATKVCTFAYNICDSQMMELLLASRSLRWFLYFWKIRSPLTVEEDLAVFIGAYPS